MAKVMLIVTLIALLEMVAIDSAPTAVESTNKANLSQNKASSSGGNNNPLQEMFRSFGQYIPNYGNNPFIPYQFPGAPYFPSGNTPFPFIPNGFGSQFIPGQPSPYGNYPTPATAGGMGYSGPFNPTNSYGPPNPGYGAFGGSGGNVPVVTTRLNQPGGSTVYTGSDPAYASVSVNAAPGQGPIFRSQTVQGPNSQGTAFAYASGQ